MKSISLVFILAYGATASPTDSAQLPIRAGAERLTPNKEGLTLRKWIANSNCMNLASQPLMNTQFAQLGALDALRDANLLEKVTGMSGVSSGAFVLALAATQDFKNNSRSFRNIWPGWANMIPKDQFLKTGGKMADPHLSSWYEKRVLNNVLPASFEELKIPLAVVAVAYDDEKAAEKIDGTRAKPVVISDGNLAEAVIVSSSAMMGKGCPRCNSGFQAKTFRGHFPTADGFLLDEYGTLGLSALAQCDNLIHFQPINYAQQLAPTKNKDLDTSPKNVVTLGIDVPSSGIMSMLWDQVLNPINNFRNQFAMGNVPLGKLANQDEIWEKIEYETAYDHMMEQLDKPMNMDPQDDEKHWFVDLDLKQHWENIRGWGEKMWDNKFDGQHGKYWDSTAERRNTMIGERNAKLKSGALSFKPCGNGMGAPECNKLGQRIPKYFKGQPVANEASLLHKEPRHAPEIKEETQAEKIKKALLNRFHSFKK